MEDLRRELQEIGPDDLDLKEIKTEIALPTDKISELVEETAVGGDWPECLERFVRLYGPPSGRHDKNVELIQELKAQAPLQFLIPSIELGPEGTTLRNPPD